MRRLQVGRGCRGVSWACMGGQARAAVQRFRGRYGGRVTVEILNGPLPVGPEPKNL